MVSPLDELRVSLDARTVEAGVGRANVKAIEADGSLVFVEQSNQNKSFEETLDRIWNEYPGGLSNIKEDELLANPGDAVVQLASEAEEDEVIAQEDDTMTPDEMEAVRSDIFVKLNDARNELWFVLELAKTLAASSSYTTEPPPPPIPVANHTERKPSKGKPAMEISPHIPLAQAGASEPPVLPPGTYSITPSLPPNTLTYQEVFELEQAMTAKQEALDECSRLMDAAVEELGIMNKASDKFWDKIRRLKDGESGRGQWAVLPRPDFGRTMADGEKARDVIIPYALDEAPAPIRASSLAAFDLDPKKADDVAFGARTYRRLRVVVTTETESNASALESREGMRDIASEIAAAQLEAFDEELFQEMRAEAARLSIEMSELDAILIPMGDSDLLFQMVDVRNAAAVHPIHPTPELILNSARLLLFRRHRRQKTAYLDGQAQNIAAPILETLLGVYNVYQTVKHVESMLQMLVNAARSAGCVAIHSVRWSISEEFSSLKDADDFGLSVYMNLDLAGCKGLSVSVSERADLLVTTSRAALPVRNISDLTRILAQDVARQILSYIYSRITEDIEEDRRGAVFLDEIDWAVILPDGSQLCVTLEAPYHRLDASVVSMPGPPEVFLPEDGKSLLTWARDVVHTRLEASGP